jgi:hypothetical protein
MCFHLPARSVPPTPSKASKIALYCHCLINAAVIGKVDFQVTGNPTYQELSLGGKTITAEKDPTSDRRSGANDSRLC